MTFLLRERQMYYFQQMFNMAFISVYVNIREKVSFRQHKSAFWTYKAFSPLINFLLLGLDLAYLVASS